MSDNKKNIDEDAATINPSRDRIEECHSDSTMDDSDKDEPIPPRLLERIPKRSVPNANVPEKIVVCVDACRSEWSTRGAVAGVALFLRSKQAINVATEFALVTLKRSEPAWACGFTRDVDELLTVLEGCDLEECRGEARFDMAALFDVVHTNVELPEVRADYKLIPPPYVVRMLVVYARESCVPHTSDASIFELFAKHPYFTADALYVHDDGWDEADCGRVFDGLQTLDDGYSFIFQTSANAKEMFECGAKLLAHPLQRPLQKDLRYDFV